MPLCATADVLGEQPVQPVEDLRPGPGQLVAAVSQQPKHNQVLVDLQLPQPAGAQRHHDDGVRVVRVALAGVAGVEHPDAGGQLRRRVEDPLGMPADDVAALDRPDPLRPAADGREGLPVAVSASVPPAPAEQSPGPRRDPRSRR